MEKKRRVYTMLDVELGFYPEESKREIQRRLVKAYKAIVWRRIMKARAEAEANRRGSSDQSR